MVSLGGVLHPGQHKFHTMVVMVTSDPAASDLVLACRVSAHC